MRRNEADPRNALVAAAAKHMTTHRTPFESLLTAIADEQAVKLLDNKTFVRLDLTDACDFARRLTWAIQDEWPKLSSLRATYPKKVVTNGQ